MNNNLKNIISKYEDDLIGYIYCENDNISNIPLGSNIIYINKNNFLKKKGTLKNYRNSILELISRNKKISWFIYIDKFYIFYKEKNNNNFKLFLKELVKDNFNALQSK